jgi:3'-5' exoribonuclease
LISGALLHDIGKALTYSTENYSFDYTDEGKLLDHIVSGIYMLEEFTSQIEDFPAELKRHLFHIIASHHGEKEFGSPVTPKTREALIINICDLLDSRLDHFETIAASTPENEMWTEYSRMLRSELFKDTLINNYN